jgi:serine/threonine-protein kinase
LIGEAPEPLRAELLPELVALEVALRRADGERPTAAEYRARFPGLGDRADVLVAGSGDSLTGGETDADASHDATIGELVREVLGEFENPADRTVTVPGSTNNQSDDATSVWALALGGNGGPAAGARGGAAGRFRVIRPHARGGLGEVFLARDEDLNREVALKQIQADHAGRADSRARFEREAEITGGLEHPGIVPVYALGRSADGRPYYAMRFVRGDTLKEAIARFHGPGSDEPGPAGRPLELRALLGRFVDVCNAIAYAHSRGVIHRDIKPSNVMLGPFGETLVVDWGLAKVVGAAEEDGGPPLASFSGSSETQPGSALGTPQYMSPEQASGEPVGPPGDVYSLGATLYHLLAGGAPFEGSDVNQTLWAVRRGEFPPPRRINLGVPAALESVCLKAMARQPGDRYPSPRDLADDVERWLADEPVSAHRDPPLARLARWARRHRPAVAGAAALAATAVVALAVGTALVAREAALKEQQRRLANANYVRARDAVDRMLVEVGAVDLADVPQMEAVRGRLLAEALRFYEGFVRQRADDARLSGEMGRAEVRLAQVQELLGEARGAEASYRRAAARLGPLTAAPAVPGAATAELARALDGLGMLLKRSGRLRAAEPALREALRLRESLAGAEPGSLEARDALAESRDHLGALLARTRDRGSEDERAFRAALGVRRGLVADARARPEHRAKLGRTLNNLGLLLRDAGDEAGAEGAFTEAASILADLAAASPSVPGYRWQWARALNNLGVVLRPRGLDPARPPAERACDLLERLAADFPGVVDYRRELMAARSNLGRLLADGGPSEPAEREYRRALGLAQELVSGATAAPDDHQRLAAIHVNQASLRQKTDPRGAAESYRVGVAILEVLDARFPGVPEYRESLGHCHYDLARTLIGLGAFDEARRSASRAVELHRPTQALPLVRDGVNVLREDYFVLAHVSLRLKDHAAAAEAAEELPRLQPDSLADHLNAAAFLAQSADLAGRDDGLDASRRHELAVRYAGRAVHWLQRAAESRLLTEPAELDRKHFDPLRGRDDFRRLHERLRRGRTRPWEDIYG